MFYAIQQEHSNEWDEILEILKTAYPDFVRLSVPAEGGDGKVLLRWFERPYEKAGSLCQPSLGWHIEAPVSHCNSGESRSPALICIDEPELGLHPDWIKLVAELLQDAAASRTQVIVATHSPQIVARLDPEQVIVAEKADGETHSSGLESQDLEKWLKDFNLSDLWLAGHFGGRP